MNDPAGGVGRRGALLGGLVYAAVAIAVVALVAAATGFRDEIRGADAWEHHRAVRVVAALGPAAGNPTFATDEPSIRYSPYTLALAWLVRHTGWSAWDALSGAAVVNTALLLLALYVLLAAFGERRAALPTLLVALLLYGVSPAYANTLALDDLPWHMVNPSALAVALCLGGWAAFRWATPSGRRLLAVAPLVSAALAFALLAHGMSGVLGGVGLAALALAERGPARRRLLVATAAVGAAAGALCLAWPYYSFARALLTNPNPGYWYNPAILRMMLTEWCLPCLVASLLAVPLRASPIVRVGLWGLGLTGALTLLAVVTRSPTFARLPLAGLVFAQVLTGVVLERWRLAEPSSWRGILAGLRSTDAAGYVPALVRVLLPALIVFFAVPKVAALVREPHLLRPLLAHRLHLRDLQAHWYAQYAAILSGVGEREVVMADPDTAWPVPSFHGRIVAAAHYEYFTPGQQQRCDDANLFVAPGTPTEVRRRLIQQYGARWILLDRTANERVLPELRLAPAVVREEGNLVLVDAQRWIAAAAGTTAGR